MYKVSLAQCLALNLKITAYKSRPSDITFNIPDVTNPKAVSLSPHGGFAAELGITGIMPRRSRKISSP